MFLDLAPPRFKYGFCTCWGWFLFGTQSARVSLGQEITLQHVADFICLVQPQLQKWPRNCDTTITDSVIQLQIAIAEIAMQLQGQPDCSMTHCELAIRTA